MTIAGRYPIVQEGQKGVAAIDLATSFIGQARKTLDCRAKVVVIRGAATFADARVVKGNDEFVARGTATLREALKGGWPSVEDREPALRFKQKANVCYHFATQFGSMGRYRAIRDRASRLENAINSV